MRIGIASNILVSSLKNHLDNVSPEHLKLGMGSPSVNNIIEGHIQNGHKVFVYTLDPKVPASEPVILEGENLKVHIRHTRVKAWKRMSDFFRYEAKQIKEMALQDNLDIINAQWSYEYALGAMWSKIPHLITFRDAAWKILRLYPNIYRLNRLMIDFWVKKNGKNFNVNSPYLQKTLKFIRKDLPVIPNPVNNELWDFNVKKQDFPEKEFKIVSLLTGWSHLKNPMTALQGFKLLRNEFGDKVSYYFYGYGYEEGGEGHQWAKENGLDEGVHFMGRVTHKELMQQIQNYNILMHPSREESFGMPLIEAMVIGMPVVGGKRSGAVPWVLNYGENGILVDIESPEEIYQGLRKLVVDKEYFEDLSERGVVYAEQHFSAQKVSEKFCELFEEILQKKVLV